MTLLSMEVAYQKANIHEDRTGEIIATATVGLTFAYAAVVLRFVSRRLARAPLKIDDWAIVIALVIATANVIDLLIGIPFGMGKHLIATPDFTNFGKNTIAVEAIYSLSIAMIKTSILLLYRRIFPDPKFHIAIYCVMGFTWAWAVASTGFAIFQCTPIEGTWNPSAATYCIDSILAVTVAAGINVGIDVVLLIMPMPILLRLHVSRRQKIELVAIFLSGFLGTIISLVRTHSLSQMDTLDPTWTMTDAAIWTVAEHCMAVVCACLPTLRPLLQPSKRAKTKGNRTTYDAERPSPHGMDMTMPFGRQTSRWMELESGQDADSTMSG